MSNYATFDADITLSGVLDVEATAEKAKQAFCVSDVSVSQVTDDTFELWFGEYTDYRDDEIHAFLQEIQPYTVSGYVTYLGESGDHWRNIFDKTSHQWVEEDGDIVYNPETRRTMDELVEADRMFQAQLCRNIFADEPER